MRYVLVMAFSLFLFPAVLTADEPISLERILDRYFEAVGGRAALEGLNTRSITGRYEEHLAYKDPTDRSFAIEAEAAFPDQWILVEKDPAGTKTQGSDGKTGWKREQDRVESHASITRSITAWWLDPRGPLRLQDYFPDLKKGPQETRDGRTEYVVISQALGAERGKLCFDAETGLLIRIGFHKELLDYKEKDGIKIPYRLRFGRKGGHHDFVIEEVKNNRLIPADWFAQPDPKAGRKDPFIGISESKVLPLLKNLPFVHGGMNVPAKDGRLLYDLIVEHRLRRGLEIGTSNGYSALWLGLGFRRTGGKVITLEIEEEPAREAAENFRKADLDDVIDLRVNDAFKEIPKLEGTFDFVFIDAWKPDYIKFLDLVRDRVVPGGVITAHNISSHGRDMQDFLKAIQNDPGLETTLHRISRAGVSISFKRK